MDNHPNAESKRVLTPIERCSEILFGVIMVLTFTCSLSVAEAGREDIRTMLIGALGCNLAWGVIDGLLYFANTVAERARGLVVLRRVHGTERAEEARALIAEALPPTLAAVLRPEELDAMRQRIIRQCDPPKRIPLKRDDFRGALAVFLLVFLSTFPIVVPFIFMRQAVLALRVSNAVAIVMLYVIGSRLGHFIGVRHWLMGASLVVVGAVLVAMTIALGG